MAKSDHPLALTLRVWASKLERNLLDPTEVRTIAELLRRIAAGECLDEILGVKRKANRPHNDTTHHYVEQVYGLTQPTYDGKAGMSVTEAIRAVASARNVDFHSVKTAYYSRPGRAHLVHIKEALKDPLA